jgi:hypothetical protein
VKVAALPVLISEARFAPELFVSLGWRRVGYVEGRSPAITRHAASRARARNRRLPLS